jgi:hypothetical protein
MEVFLDRVGQLLSVMGSNLLVPPPGNAAIASPSSKLHMETKGIVATGSRTPEGFVVFAGSQAVADLVPSSAGTGNFADRRRAELIVDGLLVPEGDHLRFTTDVEFSSPSGAASVIRGGNTNGLVMWRDSNGTPLRDLESGGTE